MFLSENHIIKQTPITGTSVYNDGCGVPWLKILIKEIAIRNKPKIDKIEFSDLLLLRCPRLISKYDNIEPALNSHIRVCIK